MHEAGRPEEAWKDQNGGAAAGQIQLRALYATAGRFWRGLKGSQTDQKDFATFQERGGFFSFFACVEATAGRSRRRPGTRPGALLS